MASDSNKNLYVPGQTVLMAGIYKVLHVKHRLPHKATFQAGGKFPACNKCGTYVRFELMVAARVDRTKTL